MRFSRPLIASLLVALVLLGHLPAWIHVANCHDPACGGHVKLLADAPKTAACSCCHHCNDSSPDGPVAEKSVTDSSGPESSEFPDHDSDSCPTCQSLATAAGVPGWFKADGSFEPALICFLLPASVRITSAIFLPPPARGPPTPSV